MEVPSSKKEKEIASQICHSFSSCIGENTQHFFQILSLSMAFKTIHILLSVVTIGVFSDWK